MPISLILTPFDHFHFRPTSGLLSSQDLTYCHRRTGGQADRGIGYSSKWMFMTRMIMIIPGCQDVRMIMRMTLEYDDNVYVIIPGCSLELKPPIDVACLVNMSTLPTMIMPRSLNFNCCRFGCCCFLFVCLFSIDIIDNPRRVLRSTC